MATQVLGFDAQHLPEEQRKVLQSFVVKNPHLKQHVSTLFKEDRTNPFTLHHLTFPRGFSHIAVKEREYENTRDKSASTIEPRQTLDPAPSPRACSSSTLNSSPPFMLAGAKLNRNNGNSTESHKKPSSDTKRVGLPTLKVTKFVDSDFGFHNERLEDTVGMSLQKNIRHRGQLKRDIQQVARKHIYAVQTPSLNYRRCRTTQAVDNLKMTLSSGKIVGSGSNKARYNKPNAPTSSFETTNGKREVHARPTFNPLKSPRGTLPAIDYDALRIVAKGH